MKKILFILLFALPLSVQGEIYAVLIGISEYEIPIGDLSYSHQDAIDMYELLKEHTAPNKLKLLINKQATRDSIVYYTTQLFRQAQPEDIVLFFFSGHGQGNNFFAHDRFLYFSELKEIFKQTQAKRRLIFADACYSGTLRPGDDPAPQNEKMNVMIFLSSRSSQYSIETRAYRNGAYTYFLLAGLRGGADFNKDGYITAKELYNFVYPKVRERTNGRQIPVMWGNFNKNMIILKQKNK